MKREQTKIIKLYLDRANTFTRKGDRLRDATDLFYCLYALVIMFGSKSIIHSEPVFRKAIFRKIQEFRNEPNPHNIDRSELYQIIQDTENVVLSCFRDGEELKV